MKISKRNRDKVLRVISDINYEEGTKKIVPEHPRLQKLKLKELMEVLNKLNSLKLIEILWADDRIYHIHLTSEGNIYFERDSDERRRFMWRSIWVPIMISFATTIVIWGVKWLFTEFL